jgi:ATP-dependent protease ClpP protease subunit
MSLEEEALVSNECLHIVNNPIVKNVYSVQLTEHIGKSEHYRELYNLLRNGKEDDTFLFYLNNYGGFVHTGIDIINSIRNSPSRIVSIVTGPLYSMAPLIALTTQQLYIEDNTFFMFHDYSGDTAGKGNEQHAAILNDKPFFDELFEQSTKGFLTPKEIKKVTSGGDLYVRKEDVITRLRKLGKAANEKN